MRATKNGWTIEGTPGEIMELVGMSANTDTLTVSDTLIAKEPVEIPEKPIKAETPKRKTPRKDIDWSKADALKDAGWNFKQIADEIGATYQGVYRHFNAEK